MRAIKNLFVLVIIVAILGGSAPIALRIARGKASGVEEVKPGIVVVELGQLVRLRREGRQQGDPVRRRRGSRRGAGRRRAGLASRRAQRRHRRVRDPRPRRSHRRRAGLGSAHVRIGAGDLALAEKKVPPEALAGKAFTAVMSYPGHRRPAIRSPAPTTFDVGEGADAKKVKAFPIPGHTPGSYAFLYDGVLFVGDAMIFKQGRLDPAIKLFDAHPDDNKASIRKLQKLVENEEIDIVCTGHGGCTPKGLGRNQLTDLVARL